MSRVGDGVHYLRCAMMEKALHGNFYVIFVTRCMMLNKELEYHQYNSGIDVKGQPTAFFCI